MTTVTEIRIVPTNKTEIFVRFPIAQFGNYLDCYQWTKAKLKIAKGCYELDNAGEKSYVFDLDKETYSFAVKNGLPLIKR